LASSQVGCASKIVMSAVLENGMLPRTIAIFDTRFVDCDDPMTLHRYALVRVQPNGGSYILSAIPEIREDARLVEAIGPYSGRFSIELYPGRERFETHFWNTGFNLEVDGQEYRVMDVDNIRVFNTWIYSIKVRGDTVFECRKRQSQQAGMRIQRIVGGVPCTPPSPKADTSQIIPVFVAQLIKEKAIATKDLCPITRTPFTQTDPATLLGCFHLFDPDGIQQWMAIKNECPICKTAIRNTLLI